VNRVTDPLHHIHDINNYDVFSTMAPNSCTVAIEIEDHHITFHFKSDNQVRNIYVHPDNIVLMSNTRNWFQRRGEEYKVFQNKYQARLSIEELCKALKADRAAWEDLSVDKVMALIYDKIGMETTLWTKIRKWVLNAVMRLVEVGVRLAIGHHTGGAIGWQ